MVDRADVAVIGGSGFYDLEGITDLTEAEVNTPFGRPSDTITIGSLADRRVAFLPRHGRHHSLLPGEVPGRANIFALKLLGVERIIGVSAVGSMREDVHPLDMVIPDQIIDRTVARHSTFFGDGVVAHVSIADPFCPHLSGLVGDACARVEVPHHRGGTYVCIEGPQFSTKAESRLYRQWGVDVIGMTVVPEAKLAREAEMCYTVLALATDYDVWHPHAGEVTVDMVIGNLRKNVGRAKEIVRSVIDRLPEERPCSCGSALRDSLITRQRDLIPAERQSELAVMIDRYLT
jgi:5'-methylthioadenosine phosphorylase